MDSTLEMIMLSTSSLTENMEDARLMLYLILSKKKLHLPSYLIIYIQYL